MRMKGYLLDTNHIDAYFVRNKAFWERLNKMVPEKRIFWISAISVGEIEASAVITSRSPGTMKEFRRFIRKEFLSNPDLHFVLPIDQHTGVHYAEILGRIWKAHPPKPRRGTEKHLGSLGVDINDVWIFAAAWDCGLTLLTSDKMHCIRECVSEDEVNIECWI